MTRIRTLAVVEAPVSGTYDALGVRLEEFYVGGSNGRLLLGSVDSTISLSAIEYAAAPASTETDATIRGITSGPPSALLAVGDGGVIRRSVDQGATWTPVDSGTTANLYGAAFTHWEYEERVAIVVGDAVMLRSTDQGLTWDPVTLPRGDERLRDVVDVLGIGWFAVGLGGVILSSDRDAAVWTAEPSPTDLDLLRVRAPSTEPRVSIVAREGALVQQIDQTWQLTEIEHAGEIADATHDTLIMRDGRIGIRGFFDPPGAYVLAEPKDPLPPLRRIVHDESTDTGQRTVVLAEDGRLLLLAQQPSRSPLCD